jgi:hypothetical protein
MRHVAVVMFIVLALDREAWEDSSILSFTVMCSVEKMMCGNGSLSISKIDVDDRKLDD